MDATTSILESGLGNYTHARVAWGKGVGHVRWSEATSPWHAPLPQDRTRVNSSFPGPEFSLPRGHAHPANGQGWQRGNRAPEWGEAYAYNDAGQVSLKANLNGDVTLFDYDQAGRLDEAQYSYASSGRVESFDKDMHRYRLPSQSDRFSSNKSLKNTVKQALGDVYYQMGGLSSVRWDSKLWKEDYTYDSAGNRSQLWATRGTIDYTYDANNRLTKAGNRSYTYDDNGNQLTETTPDETVTMAYTEDNRLKSYQRQNSITDGDDDETAHQVSYTYDPLGRRSSKSQRGHEGVRTQEYQYDGMGLDLIRIADAASLVTTPDAGTDLLKKDTVEDSRAKFIKPQRHEQYETNGLDVLYANGRIFSSLSRDKGLTIYTTDYLGSVRYTSNNHDASKHSYNYDAFGESMGAPPDLFGYNGRVYDRVTTNYDYGFRDYAPKQGRFTTVDPIQDGNNWYAYVNNDPVNLTDPTGLEGTVYHFTVTTTKVTTDMQVLNVERDEYYSADESTASLARRNRSTVVSDYDKLKRANVTSTDDVYVWTSPDFVDSSSLPVFWSRTQEG